MYICACVRACVFIYIYIESLMSCHLLPDEIVVEAVDFVEAIVLTARRNTLVISPIVLFH